MCVYVLHVCAVTCLQDIGCICTCVRMYLTAACRQAKGYVCALRVHTGTSSRVRELNTCRIQCVCVCRAVRCFFLLREGAGGCRMVDRAPKSK